MYSYPQLEYTQAERRIIFPFSFSYNSGNLKSFEFLNLGQGDVIKSIMKTVSLGELIHYGGIKLNPL